MYIRGPSPLLCCWCSLQLGHKLPTSTRTPDVPPHGVSHAGLQGAKYTIFFQNNKSSLSDEFTSRSSVSRCGIMRNTSQTASRCLRGCPERPSPQPHQSVLCHQAQKEPYNYTSEAALSSGPDHTDLWLHQKQTHFQNNTLNYKEQ